MLLETFLAASLMAPSLAGEDAPRIRHAGHAIGARASAVVAQADAKPAAPAPKPQPEPQKKPAAEAKKVELAADVKDLVDRMQAFYEKTQDFTADFDQLYSYTASKRKQKSSGKVTFKKPALMRWEYAGDAPRTFVLAGDKVYMHDPAAMLLTRASIGTSQLSASVTFLWGEGKLADEFAIEKRACSSCAGVQLQLTPLRPDPRFKRILLEVDPKTAQVLKSTVIDPDGSQNAIAFKNLKTNVGVNAEVFKLNPPEGTQVQDFTQPKP